MKKTNKVLALASIGLLSAGVLAACDSKQQSSHSEEKKSELTFPTEVTHEGTPIKGDQLNYAIVASAQSTGILIDELADTSIDLNFAAMVDASMFGYDADRKLDDSGLAKIDFDIEGKKATITLNSKDYKWSDGQPFTIDDYIFTIEGMSNKDYDGVRFGDNYLNIIGLEEFHEGKADSISGVEKVDDYTVVLKFKEMNPSMMYAGGEIPRYIMPKHIFKDIAVKDWKTSEYARTNKVVGMGPFKVKDIVSGESITYEPNEYYYKGKPKVGSLKMDVVSPDTIVSEMKAGHYDIADMPPSQIESYKDLSNITLLGSLDNTYQYLSFNFGTFDKEAGKCVLNPNAKMNDVKLRQAMGYALDNKVVAETLYHGIAHPANSLIISFFSDLHDSELEGYTYQPEKAKKLLDEAGYKDVDGDGIREDKDGKPFKVTLGASKGSEASEALVQQYLAWWKEIGLNVELYTGRTIEFNAFYDLLKANDPNIDAYVAAWGTGYNPLPKVWGPTNPFNLSRYVSDENTKLLKAMGSVESFDEKKNLENYKNWQANAFKEAFAIPTLEFESVTAVNKRVKYYDTYIGSKAKGQIQDLELTADKGIAE